MEETLKDFEDLVNNFRPLPKETKQEEIVNEIKKLLGTFNLLNESLSSDNTLILNRDINDVIEPDDYLSDLYSLIKCLENEIGKYLDAAADRMYE